MFGVAFDSFGANDDVMFEFVMSVEGGVAEVLFAAGLALIGFAIIDNCAFGPASRPFSRVSHLFFNL